MSILPLAGYPLLVTASLSIFLVVCFSMEKKILTYPLYGGPCGHSQFPSVLLVVLRYTTAFIQQTGSGTRSGPARFYDKVTLCNAESSSYVLPPS